jgi:hypothetical protein
MEIELCHAHRDLIARCRRHPYYATDRDRAEELISAQILATCVHEAAHLTLALAMLYDKKGCGRIQGTFDLVQNPATGAPFFQQPETVILAIKDEDCSNLEYSAFAVAGPVMERVIVAHNEKRITLDTPVSEIASQIKTAIAQGKISPTDIEGMRRAGGDFGPAIEMAVRHLKENPEYHQWATMELMNNRQIPSFIAKGAWEAIKRGQQPPQGVSTMG